MRKILLLLSFSLMTFLLPARSASAWCSPNQPPGATLEATPSAAAAGTAVTLFGDGWLPGTYQVVWTTTREVLGATTVVDGRFSVVVRIPAVGPGMYGITVRQGAQAGNGVLQFEVLPPRHRSPTGWSPRTAASSSMGAPGSSARPEEPS